MQKMNNAEEKKKAIIMDKKIKQLIELYYSSGKRECLLEIKELIKSNVPIEQINKIIDNKIIQQDKFQETLK